MVSRSARIFDLDGGVAAVADGIVHEVGEAAAQTKRPAGVGPRDAARDLDLAAGVVIIGLQTLEQRHRVHGLHRFLGARVAHEIQRLRDHGLHLFQVLGELRPQRLVLQHLRAQTQPRDRRFQVVRHRRENAGAIGDEARQAPLHGIERARGALRFARSGFGQRRAVDVLAQFFRGRRQLRQRTRDPAHRDQRERDHGSQQDQQRQREPQRHRRGLRRQVGIEGHPGSVMQRDLHREKSALRSEAPSRAALPPRALHHGHHRHPLRPRRAVPGGSSPARVRA